MVSRAGWPLLMGPNGLPRSPRLPSLYDTGMRPSSASDAGARISPKSTTHLCAIILSATGHCGNQRARAYLEFLATRTSTGPATRTLRTTSRKRDLRGRLSCFLQGVGVLRTGVYDGIICQGFLCRWRRQETSRIVGESGRGGVARGRSGV